MRLRARPALADTDRTSGPTPTETFDPEQEQRWLDGKSRP